MRERKEGGREEGRKRRGERRVFRVTERSFDFYWFSNSKEAKLFLLQFRCLRFSYFPFNTQDSYLRNFCTVGWRFIILGLNQRTNVSLKNVGILYDKGPGLLGHHHLENIYCHPNSAWHSVRRGEIMMKGYKLFWSFTASREKDL